MSRRTFVKSIGVGGAGVLSGCLRSEEALEVDLPEVTLIIGNLPVVYPLAAGEVVAQGIDLQLDSQTSMVELHDRQWSPEVQAVQAGEFSFSQYLIRQSQGERDWVGIPVFLSHSFVHRNFFVSRASELQKLEDLEGKRIGTNGWPDSGNTWSRAALRERGVHVDQAEWWVGPIDNPSYDSFGKRPDITLPPNVHKAEPGKLLVDMLTGGELDALMCGAPKAFYEADPPIRRLYSDYPSVEKEYLGRVGFCPAHHILVIRRPLFEGHPEVALSLFDAFEQSKLRFMESLRSHSGVTPWLEADIEEATALFGVDWQPNGVEPNRRMLQAFCEEEVAQGLVEEPIDVDGVFAEFEEARNG
jgi:4,5-dihydroxyphthalate decarboxylase